MHTHTHLNSKTRHILSAERSYIAAQYLHYNHYFSKHNLDFGICNVGDV